LETLKLAEIGRQCKADDDDTLMSKYWLWTLKHA